MATASRERGCKASLLLCLLLAPVSEGFLPTVDRTISCDVITAGGSLASLAAAIAAANASVSDASGHPPSVCFLEPTDWPGGQLTASGVPAVDFGPDNRTPLNIVKPFADFLWGPHMPGNANQVGLKWYPLIQGIQSANLDVVY
jgi:hypothetical protein